MSITPEQQREFDEYQEMFATPGWRRLVNALDSQIYEHQASALEARNWETVCHLRGRAEAFAELSNFEDSIQLQFNQLKEAEDASL